MPDFRIAVLGDSIPWGQGLPEALKYYTLVGEAIEMASGGARRAVPPVVVAHSGAVIGAGRTVSEPPVDGEIPRSLPSILDQCATFPEDPLTIDLVLLAGGINDVGVWRILNPLIPQADLRSAIRRHCYTDMTVLLDRVATLFANPTTTIILSGYYPILSSASHPPLVRDFLRCVGVPILEILEAAPPIPGLALTGDPVTAEIVEQCRVFWEKSTTALRDAVADINRVRGGLPRIRFATPEFTERNAALAPDAWLWGIRSDSSPEDPMAVTRQIACDRHEPNPLRRFTCHRASGGHPNIRGAERYAAAIRAALGI
jgi:hypothetical protein